MTFHSAKGLEFDIVFMTGLEDGLFPLFRTLDSLEALEEERRLFYVGATRAMNRLFLTYAGCRHRNGMLERSLPSRFLMELDRACLQETIVRPVPTPETKSKHAMIRPRIAHPQTVSAELPLFAIGQSVRHQHFGSGTVTLVEGTGDDAKVHVQFGSTGIKKLLVKYAKLSVF
jgi:DNA helicase-2/ATP-dependent DNA helicase PcrA